MKNGKLFHDANKKVQQKKIIGEISDNLIEKLKQIKKKRMYVNQQSKLYLSDNFPVFAFFAQCIREHQLDIPIFEKLKDSTLEIRNQKLSTGHCEAIKEGFRVIKESLKAADESKSTFVNHVILENNGLNDKQQAVIIEGVNQLKVMRSFLSIKNEIK
jgi:hypothetical protein